MRVGIGPGDHRFPDLVELWMYGRFYASGMGSYHPLVCRCLSESEGAVSPPGTTVFVPSLLELICGDFSVPGAADSQIRRLWFPHCARRYPLRGTTVFVPGLLELWIYGKKVDAEMRRSPGGAGSTSLGRYASADRFGLSKPCKSASGRGTTVFVPCFLEL